MTQQTSRQDDPEAWEQIRDVEYTQRAALSARKAEAKTQWKNHLRRRRQEAEERNYEAGLVPYHLQRILVDGLHHKAQPLVDQYIAQPQNRNEISDTAGHKIATRDKDTVEVALKEVLHQIPLPQEFPRRVDVNYYPASEHAVVRFQLPDETAMPEIIGYGYIQSRDEIYPVTQSLEQRKELLSSVATQVALLALKELFEADTHLKSIDFDGYINAINPSTGGLWSPSLVNVRVNYQVFGQLTLSQVQPEACLRRLNTLTPKNLHNGKVLRRYLPLA